jgi:4a-hydroxytetrahydrobiopterin dehydratase
MSLLQKNCVPGEGGNPLPAAQVQELLKETPGWNISANGESLERTFTYKNFTEALASANIIGAIADAEGHHPDLLVAWGKVAVTLSTHAIKGLSENDFILAAKITAALEFDAR